MKITVIPAIDVIGGKCVRLTRGNYDECKTYYDDPVEAARRFEDMGMKRLHLVDLDGARESRVINWRVLERICVATRLEVDFSGGIKSDEDICRVFDAGASFVCIGSMAQQNREKTREWSGKIWGRTGYYRGRCKRRACVCSGVESGDGDNDI